MSSTIETRSVLQPPAAEVWAHACTMEGVNAELWPWVRMSVPRSARGQSLDAAPLGEVAFPSVLLALGIAPFDVHYVTLVERGEQRFLEASWSWLHRSWRHERTVLDGPRGCEVLDRVTVTPRIAGAEAVVRPVVRAIFQWRHRYLRRRFGVTTGAAPRHRQGAPPPRSP